MFSVFYFNMEPCVKCKKNKPAHTNMGTKVPGHERSQERKFPGTFNERARERKFQGTFVPREQKFPGERKVPGTKGPSREQK